MAGKLTAGQVLLVPAIIMIVASLIASPLAWCESRTKNEYKNLAVAACYPYRGYSY